jgi:hypothetical protein
VGRYGPTKQKLLARVDASFYTKSLEQSLDTQTSVDVNQLQSKITMSRVNLKLQTQVAQDDLRVHLM